jgi:hypothetical protein
VATDQMFEDAYVKMHLLRSTIRMMSLRGSYLGLANKLDKPDLYTEINCTNSVLTTWIGITLTDQTHCTRGSHTVVVFVLEHQFERDRSSRWIYCGEVVCLQCASKGGMQADLIKQMNATKCPPNSWCKIVHMTDGI